MENLILKEHILKTDSKEVIKKAEELAKINDRVYGTANTPARFYDYGTKQELLAKHKHPGIVIEPNTVFWKFRSEYALETARRMLK